MAYFIEDNLCDLQLKNMSANLNSQARAMLTKAKRLFFHWKDNMTQDPIPELTATIEALSGLWRKASLTHYTFNHYLEIKKLNEFVIEKMAPKKSEDIQLASYISASDLLRFKIAKLVVKHSEFSRRVLPKEPKPFVGVDETDEADGPTQAIVGNVDSGFVSEN